MAVVRIDSVRVLQHASLTTSYVALGTAITHNWGLVCISNNTDGDMYISVDGTTDNLFVAANSYKLFDLSANATPNGSQDAFVFALYTQFYVKYITAPTVGAIYLEGIYARGL